jgi:dienelactone hydrolase
LSFKKATLGLCSIAIVGGTVACSGSDTGNGTIPDVNAGGSSVGGAAFGAGGSIVGGGVTGAGGTPAVTGNGGTPVVGSGGFVTTGSGGVVTTGSGGVVTTGSGGVPSAGGMGTAGASGGGAAGAGTGGDNTGGAGGGGTGPAPTADSAASKGMCTVAQYTMGIPTAADYATPQVYYPTSCTGPFPGVVIIPGFTEVQAQIAQWGTFLASHGFAVMMIDSAASGAANTGVLPPSRASGLAEGVTTLKGENTRSGSPLSGKVDVARMAVMGHSMGGGGTLLAANAHSDLKAAIGLCPWNPGGTYPMDTVPTLFFDGTADTLVPPSAATAEYMSIPATTHKTYAEFNGGTHFVANTPLSAAATDKVVARIGLSWLEVYVVGDTRYQQFIMKDATMSNYDAKP